MREEKNRPMKTFTGKVVLRPVFRDRMEREIAFLETEDGRNSFELIFVSENPTQLEVTKTYNQKNIICKGDFWFRNNGDPIFFSRYYEKKNEPKKAIRKIQQPNQEPETL